MSASLLINMSSGWLSTDGDHMTPDEFVAAHTGVVMLQSPRIMSASNMYQTSLIKFFQNPSIGGTRVQSHPSKIKDFVLVLNMQDLGGPSLRWQ
ncbi:hypothetical protein Ddye_023995 [Dipteronia dyeriana]|uniref:Uncharacterized protein n=1 Tax=Dipteronia dyeriana TaxID=168575 RepID=A0AAD9TU18_9ROSI|nr:hypothetical protein Ddye_023995 [Dipteronia dyeriana]